MFFFDIGHPFYRQLTPLETRYPLTRVVYRVPVDPASQEDGHQEKFKINDFTKISPHAVTSCLFLAPKWLIGWWSGSHWGIRADAMVGEGLVA